MTFAARETSRSLGQPDTLIKFTSGTDVYAYTDSEESITHASVEYLPIPLDRDSVVSSGNLDKTTLKISLPVSTEIAELFRVFPPSEVVTCVIMQGHGGDPDNQFLAVWSGRVLSCSRAKSKAVLACEPVSTAMRRPGLRRRYQYGCPHVLYGPACRANREDFTVDATVAAVDGAYIKLTTGWQGSFDKARFANGVLVWGSEVRTILQVAESEETLIVSGAMSGLNPGATVSLSLGCARNMSDCLLFDNMVNFGGHPWIPQRNPLGTDSQFY